jgi:hypothetical protein
VPLPVIFLAPEPSPTNSIRTDEGVMSKILPEIVRQLGDVCIHSLFVLTGLATACAKPPHSHVGIP